MKYAEHVVTYGDNLHGVGVVTLPDGDASDASSPMFVMFNSGLIHKQGPFQLNALLARRLAECGISSVRFDLSNKGDSGTREGLSNRASVEKDWSALSEALESRFQVTKFVGFGLCSGADNALKIAALDERMSSVVLLDPIIPKDAMYGWRRLKTKLAWLLNPKNLAQYLESRRRKPKASELDAAPVEGLRDLPTEADWDQYLESMETRDGHMLSVFTSYAFDYYNSSAQIHHVFPKLVKDRYTQRMWFDVSHVYTDVSHRERLIDLVCEWSKTLAGSR